MSPSIHSIWLMPAPGDHDVLAALVAEMARRFGAPLFAPHLTIRGDTMEAVAVLQGAIDGAASAITAFSGRIEAVETSDVFFRSFYARFAPSPPLRALKQRLDSDAAEVFLPHVSLLYGPVPSGPKASAADEVRLRLAGRTIVFDRLCVVSSGQEVPIDQWRIVGEARLSGRG